MDWKHFTTLTHIKNLPLYEQKRRYAEMISEAEESIKQHQITISQQNAAANSKGNNK